MRPVFQPHGELPWFARRRTVSSSSNDRVENAVAMNDDLWKWAGHIYASYAITGLVLTALAAWLIWDGRRQQRRLDALEARGIRRRADEG